LFLRLAEEEVAVAAARAVAVAVVAVVVPAVVVPAADKAMALP
jgi:hypothetical protein